jgi:hypothetical protein
MKKIFLLSIVLMVLVTSCDEKMITIPDVVPDSDRVVLIEEFTGVECVNCPQGSAELENLLGLYGDNLVAVSIHAGVFADPYPTSKYDFRTVEGEAIQEFVGNPIGWPSAVINRTNPNGSSLQLPLNRWAGAIEDALKRAPRVSIAADLEYESVTRNARIEVRVVGRARIDEPVFLTVLVKENHIEDVQLTPMGLQDDYDHKHVLRRVITPFSGERLRDRLDVGEVLTQTYSLDLDESWIVPNCRLVAFVHLRESNKEVLQALEIAFPQ